MKAAILMRRRVVLAVDAFAEIVIWKVPEPVPPSEHGFKFRLAYIVDGNCVLRYDNERGKGDHRHAAGLESPYEFTNAESLLANFEADIARWNDEHGRL